MAEVKGTSGSITYTNLTAGVKSWSLNYTCDTVDTTDFGNLGVASYLGTITRWNATATANWDGANTAKPGDSATLTLTVTSGKTYAGTAICTGMTPSSEVAGVAQATYTFQGSGTLTVA